MRSYYSSKIKSFLVQSTETILGILSDKHSHNLEILQKNAWIDQIDILKDQFREQFQFL